MGLLNSFYYIGQIMASGIAVPLGRRATNWSWRGPLYVQLGFPIINVLCMPFLPESPRYLYAHGKPDQARRVLADLHSANRDIHSPLVNLEIDEIEESISVSGNHKWWDFRGLFSTRSSRYRTYLCLLVSVYGQLSGNGLITCGSLTGGALLELGRSLTWRAPRRLFDDPLEASWDHEPEPYPHP